MKDLIKELKYKIGIWLITDKKFIESSMTITKLSNEMRCIHCGKNPYFEDKNDAFIKYQKELKLLTNSKSK